MGSITVIDTLLVKLGLDPRDFTKGEKQAAAQTVQLEQQVKKSTGNMSRDMLGFTSKVIGIASAAVAVKKFISFASELSTNIRQLGLDADNFNIAAAQLRNFGNIAEMNGGKAGDATKTIGSLSKAVYDLAYNGSMSDSLIMLGRLGVQFQDTAGNMRDFKSIVMDTQKSIQTSMHQGTSRASAYQMLLQAGFDPGLANAMIQGDVGQQLARQEQRRQITGKDVRLATDWEKSAANRSQALDAATVRQLVIEAFPGTAANNAIAATADAAGTANVSGAVSSAGKMISEAGQTLKDGTVNFLRGMEHLADDMHAKNMPRGRAAYEATIQAAAKKNGLNPEELAAILQTESGFNPAAKSSTGRVGIAQLTPKYFPGAGKDPYADIYTAAAEYARLRKLHAADGDDAAMSYLALQDYNAGARGGAEMRAGQRPFQSETAAYPGKVLGYASQATPSPNAQSAVSNNNRTEIVFEEVNVNTSAKDGAGIAQDFVDASRRKLMAAQADRGPN